MDRIRAKKTEKRARERKAINISFYAKKCLIIALAKRRNFLETIRFLLHVQTKG